MLLLALSLLNHSRVLDTCTCRTKEHDRSRLQVPRGQSVESMCLPQQLWSGPKVPHLFLITDSQLTCPADNQRQQFRPWAFENPCPGEAALRQGDLAKIGQASSPAIMFGPI